MKEPACILVVDDEDAVRFFIGEVLSSRGYRVDGACNGEQALAKIRAGGLDLVLLDYKMTGMTGLDVLREMRSEPMNPSVILLTAYGTLDMAVELMRGGGLDFLKKPCSNQDLIASVERALAKRRGEQQRDQMAKLMEETLRQAQILEAFTPAPAPNDRYYEIHGLVVDRVQESVSRAGEMLPLTRTEYRLLTRLMDHPETPVNYNELYEAVYGLAIGNQEKLEARQALSTHLWRLRQKLGNDPDGRPYIMNVHGGFYCFSSGRRRE